MLLVWFSTELSDHSIPLLLVEYREYVIIDTIRCMLYRFYVNTWRLHHSPFCVFFFFFLWSCDMLSMYLYLSAGREQPSTVIIYLALSVYYCFNFLKKLLHRKLCTITSKDVVQFICSSVTILVKRLADIAFNHFIQQSGGWVSNAHIIMEQPILCSW